MGSVGPYLYNPTVPSTDHTQGLPEAQGVPVDAGQNSAKSPAKARVPACLRAIAPRGFSPRGFLAEHLCKSVAIAQV